MKNSNNKIRTIATSNYPVYNDAGEMLYYEIGHSYNVDCDYETTRNAPQNSGVAQILFHYSLNSYGHNIKLIGEEACLSFAKLNKGYGHVLKVIEVDYNVHQAKKEQLNQRGRMSVGKWIEIENENQAKKIIDHNKMMLNNLENA